MRLASALLYILSLLSLYAHSGEPLDAFPEAEQGMSRFVLSLPRKNNESLYQVEIIIGKTVQVDAHNQYFFGGNITKETVNGWGYSTYKVKELGPMAGTLMAVNPEEEAVSRFITLGGAPYFIRYNSKLPIVVYVPSDAEVKYRVWKAKKLRSITQG